MLDSGLTMWLCYRLLWSLISLLPYIIHVTNNLMLNNNFFLGWKVGNTQCIFEFTQNPNCSQFLCSCGKSSAYGLLIDNYCYSIKGKKAKAHTSQRPKWLELILVCLAWSMPRIIATSPGWDASPPPPPPSMSSVPICTLVYREKVWSKVPCLMKQGNGRGLNPGPPDLNFETTWPCIHASTLLQFSVYKNLKLNNANL